MESDKVAKVTHIPAPSVKKILAEMAERDLVREENGIWGLTGAGEEIEKELKKRG
jgi:Mn-dependent DtxR family transcriptional regulator